MRTQAESRDPGRASVFLPLACFGALSVYFTGFFPSYTSPNEVSRLETVYAAVELGTFQIDRALPVLGDHEDKSTFQSHFYSNKAPGLALAAIPLYRALRVFFPRPRTSHDAVFVLLRIAAVSIICLIALARFVRRMLAAHGSSAPLLLVAVAFGTPFLYYAWSFFSHAWTASLLFLSWDLLRRGDDMPEPAQRRFWFGVLAGLLASWAVVSEYSAAVVAGFLLMRALSGHSPRRGLGFLAGTLPPLFLLLAYNVACFGSPWSLSSAHEAHPEFVALARQGVFGFGPPSVRVAFRFLVDPARGLLLRSPFWIWAVPGFVLWWRSRQNRADLFFSLGTVLIFIVILSGYPNWYGGWCLGNRYLLPVLFFAALSLGHALRHPLSRSLFAAATVYSVLNYFLLTSAWPYLPPDLGRPEANASLWFLRRGWVAPNLLDRFGVASLWLPALLTVSVIFSALWTRRSVFRTFVPITIGAVATLVLVASPSRLSYGPSLWRAAIFDAYSPLDPQRVELVRAGISQLPPEERARAYEAWRSH